MKSKTLVQKNTGYWSASVLKYIAMGSMLIDHFAKVVLWQWLNLDLTAQMSEGLISYSAYQVWYDFIVTFLPSIGRIAFPLLCFLLVEGYLHTKNKGKYLARLAVFALLSELPFDMAFFSWWEGFPFYPYYQNVMFTLLLGLIMLVAVGKLESIPYLAKKKLTLIVLQVAVAIVIGVLADWGITDYGSTGILYIYLLYLLREKRMSQALAVVAVHFVTASSPSVFVLVAALAIVFYNGQRGQKHPKYLFYAFYPVHLLVLYFVAQWMG